MKVHNFEQRTPEWFAIRKGKMTASNAQAIGNCGKGLDTYITELMSELYSSAEPDSYSGKDTERGHELEPIARSMYELETGYKVDEVGFIEFNEFIGCSPDGLVGKDGGIEIKCVNDVKHYELLRDGENKVESKYLWQVQMCLLITKRKWWDLVYFNPNFQNSMKIMRIIPDNEKIEALKVGLSKGTEMILKQLK